MEEYWKGIVGKGRNGDICGNKWLPQPSTKIKFLFKKIKNF